VVRTVRMVTIIWYVTMYGTFYLYGMSGTYGMTGMYGMYGIYGICFTSVMTLFLHDLLSDVFVVSYDFSLHKAPHTDPRWTSPSCAAGAPGLTYTKMLV